MLSVAASLPHQLCFNTTHAVQISKQYTQYGAALLFFVFGFKMLYEVATAVEKVHFCIYNALVGVLGLHTLNFLMVAAVTRNCVSLSTMSLFWPT